MAKLKLGSIADDKPVKLTVELPAAVHRDLLVYADALAAETNQKVDPTKLVGPMLSRFRDDEFTAVPGYTGGEVHALVATLPVTVPHIRRGRLRALAVAGLKRAGPHSTGSYPTAITRSLTVTCA